ncbi:MAG: hypothetical protein L6R38_000150 [Xanthoria sp. 2 TBL-2021]|nr:MAG: hypothetical protein L6R38_000150 [Xanthoria sp. 2 TBL-2021]
MPPRTNLSQVEIPKDFMIYPRSVSLGPPREGFFYNTIIALQEVALGDYNAIMPVQSFSSGRFPEPAVQFYGMGAGLPRRYLVWGLVMSIWNMLFTSDFRTSLVLLLYRYEEVGGIYFGPQESVTSLLRLPARKGDTTVTRKILPTSDPSNSTTKDSSNPNNITINPLTANRVTVEINSFGSPFPANNVFMAIISALSEAAVHPSTDRLQDPFSSHFESLACYFVTRPVMPPRRTPPIYEWRHLIQALPQVMEYMVARAVYRESSIEIKVDGVTVGLATFFDEERVKGLREG